MKGLPETIETVYPHTQVQLCIVHQVRNSLRCVTWKDRKRVAADLRAVYTAPTVEAVRVALGAFAGHWGEHYSATTSGWERNWERLRKIIQGRGAFPHDDTIRKLLYLGLKNASKKWTMPIRDWKAALNQFIILYGDRVPV